MLDASHDLPIIIRPVVGSDLPMVRDHWLSSLGAQKPWADLPNAWYQAAGRALLGILLARSTVLVAAAPIDPDEIYGFIVAEPHVRALHWLYTKHPFRRGHVATRLMRHTFERLGADAIDCTVSTPAIRHHRERWNLRFSGRHLGGAA